MYYIGVFVCCFFFFHFIIVLYYCKRVCWRCYNYIYKYTRFKDDLKRINIVISTWNITYIQLKAMRCVCTIHKCLLCAKSMRFNYYVKQKQEVNMRTLYNFIELHTRKKPYPSIHSLYIYIVYYVFRYIQRCCRRCRRRSYIQFS